MWAIILAGFCMGVINVSQPAPTYNIMAKKIEDGQLQLDVNEICKGEGYVRPKRDASLNIINKTLLNEDRLNKTSEYSIPTESPSTIVWADETETEQTVTAVADTAKETSTGSDHHTTETVIARSEDNGNVTTNKTLLNEDRLNKTSEYSIPTESPSTIVWADETETEQTVTAVADTAKETSTGSDHHTTETVIARSEDNGNVTTSKILLNEDRLNKTSEYSITTESPSTILWADETETEQTVTAVADTAKETSTGSDHHTTETVIARSEDNGNVTTNKTLLNEDRLNKTSEYSIPTESPSTIVWADETETEQTVTAVADTAKETSTGSDHHTTETVIARSEDNGNVTTSKILLNEDRLNKTSEYSIPTESPSTIVWADETETEQTVTAVADTAKETSTGSDHHTTEKVIARSEDNGNVTTNKTLLNEDRLNKTSEYSIPTESPSTIVWADETETEQTVTAVADTAKETSTGSDHHTTETVIARSEDNGIVTTSKILLNEDRLNKTSEYSITTESPSTILWADETETEQTVTAVADTAKETSTGSDHHMTETVVAKSEDNGNVTTKNDTVSGSEHGTTVTGEPKEEHELTGKPKNDTTTKSVDDKTVTVDNSTVKSRKHYVAPKPVDRDHTESPAKQIVDEPASTHGTSGTGMSVVGILLTSLAVAGIIIGISYIVYKKHKSNSYVLPEQNVAEATPLNHSPSS